MIGLPMEPTELSERLGRWSAGRGPLWLLLARRLRSLIDDGDLPPGTPLPPDRALAAVLAVGRSTVVQAYDLLVGEERVVRRQGSGTWVAGEPRDEGGRTTSEPMFLHLLQPRDGVVMLACAAPMGPPQQVAAAFARVGGELAGVTGDIGYHPLGHPALRAAIARHYDRRGVPTTPDQVLVTTGGQQALWLVARALVQPGDHVVVETPTYPGALEAFRERAAVLVPLPVGLPGLDAAARHRRPALAYVIPTFQNPTGSVLPSPARDRLASAAAGVGIPLLEDEVLAELPFDADAPVPDPLARRNDDVIGVGSLSKLVWGGLRVGWVRARPALIHRLARLRSVHDLGGSIPAQLAAVDLLADLEALRRRSARDRHRAHDHLRGLLSRALPEWEVPAVPGGQSLWIRLPAGDGTSFAQVALRHGVAILPGAGLDPGGRCDAHVRVHYLAPLPDLDVAVDRLAAAWRVYRPPARRPASPPLAAL